MPARRRAFTKAELQTFFDAADDLVDTEFAKGSKRWLSALRGSTAFKIAYAYGLRRRELAMLEYVDFGPNPHVEAFGRFGALQVRWAKGTKGSGPRRRTVLTVPEFDWVVGLLEYWLSPNGRKRLPSLTSNWRRKRAFSACSAVSFPIDSPAFFPAKTPASRNRRHSVICEEYRPSLRRKAPPSLFSHAFS